MAKIMNVYATLMSPTPHPPGRRREEADDAKHVGVQVQK